MKLSIVYEDNVLLVVNKPAGVVVNRAESVKGETIQDWMESQPWYGTWKHEGNESEQLYLSRSGIVHRLDKDTSGVLVLAKDPVTLLALMSQFKERETQKSYLALVHGKMHAAEDTISLPLARSSFDRQRFFG